MCLLVQLPHGYHDLLPKQDLLLRELTFDSTPVVPLKPFVHKGAQLQVDSEDPWYKSMFDSEGVAFYH